MRHNRFSAGASGFDSDTDLDELSDGEISKLVIVTQTPSRPRKHEGFDRTGDFVSRAKMSQELAQVINDGLVYYEEGRMMTDESEEETDDDGWVSVYDTLSTQSGILISRFPTVSDREQFGKERPAHQQGGL